MNTPRIFVVVLAAGLVVGGIFYQLNLQREIEAKRLLERQYMEAQQRAQRQHMEALKQYDRDIQSFKQLAQ
jgi:hypothetical protein